MERELPDLDLSEYSGAFGCGSPWDANADDHLKEERQVRAEAWLRSFYDRALGATYLNGLFEATAKLKMRA